jgi:NAD(P)-dependent dehydrogenase (short-subunit alcohol dehydrogenase family)
MKLSGKITFITGGGSGIGLAAAKAFVRAGAKVVVACRGGESAAKQAGARFVPCDVRDEASIAGAVARTVEEFGRLDIAFNCAGVGGDFAPLHKTDQAIWDEVMAVNARGVWLAMRHEIPAMLAGGGGAIVNMGSIYSQAGRASHHAYVASKHAVIGMTRSVALEVATRGVRVNAVCPGVTATPAMRTAAELAPEMVQGLVAEHPMGRMATEEEVASAVLWLASDGAGFVTGTALSVDGGFSAA